MGVLGYDLSLTFEGDRMVYPWVSKRLFFCSIKSKSNPSVVVTVIVVGFSTSCTALAGYICGGVEIPMPIRFN